MAIVQEETWTKADFRDLAKKQQQVRWVFLLVVAASLAFPWLPVASTVLAVVSVTLAIWLIYLFYKFSVSVLPAAAASSLILVLIVLHGIFSSIPLLGFLIDLIVLSYVDRQATRLLRAGGIKVGPLGASRQDLDGLSDDFTYHRSL